MEPVTAHRRVPAAVAAAVAQGTWHRLMDKDTVAVPDLMVMRLPDRVDTPVTVKELLWSTIRCVLFFSFRGVWESGDWVGSLAGNFLIVSLLRVICTVSYGVHLSCRK